MIERLLAKFGYFKNPDYDKCRSMGELERMEYEAKLIEERGFTVFNYAPGVGLDGEIARAVEYVGMRGYITVAPNGYLFGAISRVFESSDDKAQRLRSAFKLVDVDDES